SQTPLVNPAKAHVQRLKAAWYSKDPFTMPHPASDAEAFPGIIEYAVPDSRAFSLHGDFQVHDYTGIDHLPEALRHAAPTLFTAGSRIWSSAENATIHLAQIL